MMDFDLKEAIANVYTRDEYDTEYVDLKKKMDPVVISEFVTKHQIRTDVHDMCRRCQVLQIMKFQQAKLKDFDPNKFEVKCKFVPRSLPAGAGEQARRIAIEQDMDLDDAVRMMQATIDPVAWAEMMFGFRDIDKDNPKEESVWKLRPWQKEELRCTANRMVLRQGRRTGKTFCIALKLLYLAFTRTIKKGRDSNGRAIEAGAEIIIITPFQSQIDNIFEEMGRLLKRNQDLSNDIDKTNTGSYYKKTPYYRMEFKGSDKRVGASISGFVTGVGQKADGSGGGSLRGDSCDIMYLDEMDMIPEEVIKKVVAPLIMTTADFTIYASSTPIGKIASFHEYCLNRPDFKEFYFPSTILGHWAQVKREMIAEVGEENIKTELLAKFVDGEFGVFKPSYIHESRANYEYSDTNRNQFWKENMGVDDMRRLIPSIGIDWNKNAGTEFYVSGMDPITGLIYGLEATNIPASDISAQEWKQEVKRLNYKWKPAFIYADEGYGHTVIEDLKVEANELKYKKNRTPFEQETVRILDRLKSFNFSSTIELRDPVEGKVFEKPAKFFLVESAIRTMENHKFYFPETDTVLVKQMSNYVVLKTNTQTGKPVYAPINSRIGDHRLDAWMLSLVGFYLERGTFAYGNYGVGAPGLLLNPSLDPATKKAQSEEELVEYMRKNKIPMNITLIKRSQQQEHLIEGQRNSQQSRTRGNLKNDIDVVIPSSAYDTDTEDIYRQQHMQTARRQARGNRKTRSLR